MLVDDPVAGLARGPRVDAERGDAEVMPDGPERLAPVVDLVDLFDSRNGVVAHGSIVSRPSQAARASSSACTPPPTPRPNFTPPWIAFPRGKQALRSASAATRPPRPS